MSAYRRGMMHGVMWCVVLAATAGAGYAILRPTGTPPDTAPRPVARPALPPVKTPTAQVGLVPKAPAREIVVPSSQPTVDVEPALRHLAETLGDTGNPIVTDRAP